MSLDATRWAWLQIVGATEKLVLLSMADRAGEEHTAWPSIARLSRDTNLNAKTVRAAIRRLESAGHIRREQRPGATTVYRLIGVQDRHSNSGQSATANPSQNWYPTPPKIGTPPLPKLVAESTNEPTRNLNNSADALSSASGRKPSPIPDCPHREIIDAHNEILPELPAVLAERWGGKRADDLRARWRESPKHQGLTFWRWFFGEVRKNRFYLGENDRGWRADLGWLITRRNFDKILENAVSAQRRRSA